MPGKCLPGAPVASVMALKTLTSSPAPTLPTPKLLRRLMLFTAAVDPDQPVPTDMPVALEFKPLRDLVLPATSVAADTPVVTLVKLPARRKPRAPALFPATSVAPLTPVITLSSSPATCPIITTLLFLVFVVGMETRFFPPRLASSLTPLR